MNPTSLRCPACNAASPVAMIVAVRADDPDAPAEPLPLLPRDHALGRGTEVDLLIGGERASVSRLHAHLRWTGNGFALEDAGSSNGTFLNGRRLDPHTPTPLTTGDRLRLGGLELAYVEAFAPSAGPGPLPYDLYLRLLREMSSLDAAKVVPRALDLLRLVSGVQRAYLVGSGADPRLEPLLTSLDAPDLKVSRSSIERALAEGRKVTLSLGPDDSLPLATSVLDLSLRRIWVSPVRGAAGLPVAAVYLDSREAAAALPEETERLMDAVVEQITLSLRNASLHAEVVSLNEGLERKVAERTRQLEDSQTRLIGQDRLATLGRLVAAIAHELNNPVGAIASFADSLRSLRDPVLRLGLDLESAFPAEADAALARRLLDDALESAASRVLDTRARRDLETRLVASLTQADVPNAENLAHRLARTGLSPEETAPAASLLQSHGETLAALVERAFTFGRGIETIRQCAGNVARIVDGLKTYAHLDQSHLEEADLHQGIQATLTVLAPRIPKGVAVETRFDAMAPFPHRPGELTQVWTNLVDNALRAMGESGVLRIETHDEGGHVTVTIADSGPGIPAPLQARIFDLDVTTRGPGAGLGLGLPICRAIVEKNHGGRLSFTSRPGETVFRAEIPKGLLAIPTPGGNA